MGHFLPGHLNSSVACQKLPYIGGHLLTSVPYLQEMTKGFSMTKLEIRVRNNPSPGQFVIIFLVWQRIFYYEETYNCYATIIWLWISPYDGWNSKRNPSYDS